MKARAVDRVLPASAGVGGVGIVRQQWLWLAGPLVAVLLPWLAYDWTTGRHSGFVVMMLSQIGMMIIFALSYNMQMGQAGLLSFGHAVFLGLGGYCTAHALNAIKARGLWIPVEILPLVGGLGGLLFAIVFGYVATKQRATAFAMITLGIGELVTAAALMFRTFFGGEGGISTNRMIGASLVGASYGSPLHVYYLVVAWTAVASALMLYLTRTPLGRMANACRDNFERAQFVGYDPRIVRFLQFSLSGFFAGIAGGLYALTYEIVTFDAVAAPLSANALLMTYIGGVAAFGGPILGAVLVVLLQSWVSLLSNSWLVYVGALFILMVTFAPGGIAGLLGMHQPLWRAGRLRRLIPSYVVLLLPALITVIGFVLTIELCSFLTIGSAQGKTFTIRGLTLDPNTARPWVVAGALLLLGGLWLWREAIRFRRVWERLMEDLALPGAKR
jgi:branched-chain amino acid transport system permease protein